MVSIYIIRHRPQLNCEMAQPILGPLEVEGSNDDIEVMGQNGIIAEVLNVNVFSKMEQSTGRGPFIRFHFLSWRAEYCWDQSSQETAELFVSDKNTGWTTGKSRTDGWND